MCVCCKYVCELGSSLVFVCVFAAILVCSTYPHVHAHAVERVVNTDGPNPSQVTPADRLQRELLHTTAQYHVPSSAVSSKGASFEQRLQNMEYSLGTGGKFILYSGLKVKIPNWVR